MTLEPGTALNEVLVYDNLRLEIWTQIIHKILEIQHRVFFTQELTKTSDIKRACFESYYLKNSERMRSITQQFGHPEVQQFVEDTSLELCKEPVWTQCLHGDSHLGNIIYDPFTGSLKFVDPRGSFGDADGNSGDLRYDMAKLLQDFYCGYAMIMADRYKITSDKFIEIMWVGETGSLTDYLEAELEAHGYDVHLLKKLAIVLMVTAIPFHEDNPRRQSAFFYRALSLIKLMKATSSSIN